MDIKSIKDFINDEVIFSGGIDCYESSLFSGFTRNEGIIEALISGSSHKSYHVQIKLDKSGHPRTASCSCRYRRGIRVCEHIAAVLIYNFKQNIFIDNPIRQSGDIGKEVVINLKNTEKSSETEFNFVDFLLQATGLPKDRDIDKRFKLVFVLDFNDDYDGKRWIIYPGCMFIKTNGEGGRIEKYKEERITESFGKFEKQLLYRLRAGEDENYDLINHIDFLIDSKISSIFMKDRMDYLPVSFIKIESININFVIDKIQNKGVYFMPEISFAGDIAEAVMGKGFYFRFVRSGFSFVIICDEGKIFFCKDNEHAIDLLELFINRKQSFTYKDIKRLRAFYPSGENGINVGNVLGKLKIRDCIPKPFIEIEERYSNVYIELWFDYEDVYVSYNVDRDYIFKGNKKACYEVFRRNYEFEKSVFQFFKVKLKTLVYYDFLYSHFRVPADTMSFIVEHGKKILDEGIEIRLKDNKKKISSGGGSIGLRINPGMDWFEVKVEYQDARGGMNSVSFDESLLSMGLIKAGDNYIIISEEDIIKLRALMDEGMSEDGELKISKYHYHFIDDYYMDIINRQDSRIESIRKISARMKDFKKIKKYQLPRSFNGVLRDYQYAGYGWLFFLRDYDLNGCLADDMGLGKTVQALAFLQKLKEENKLTISMVVVPVNTLANWESEIERFTPEMKYLLHYGAGRDKELENIDRYDFILSSYHTLRNDIELFKEISFSYIILDESQSIKNSNSILFKTMRILKSDHRLSLTGTPVENNTLELWSQMEFLNPGILGSRNEFFRKFARPIEQNGDRNVTEKLKKIIYPFLLRRRKEDVVKELPDKSEIILYSRMEEKQSDVYEQHRNFYRDAIFGKIERDGIEKSAIEIFAALLKLRQIALFPVLSDVKFKNVESCKFQQLKDIVDEILQENHKIVIFSQFVKCLQIIKRYVKRKNYRYSYIDGSMNAGKRKIEISTFQENEDYKVFLLSLKAGGVGINLTSADYVILFDPWWNPAVENQAVDRLHRIGQTRKVLAYKMVVKDTVEEKMLELQERKKKLVSELITTESSFFKSLSKEDVVRLFEAV